MNECSAIKERSKIPFPNCSKDCLAMEHFGVCECESLCPHKFDNNGNPLKTLVFNTIVNKDLL